MHDRRPDQTGAVAAHALALDCVTAGIERALPEQVVAGTISVANGSLTVQGASYDLGSFEEVHVDLAYSIPFIQRPPDQRQTFVVPPVPLHTRGGGVQTVEETGR